LFTAKSCLVRALLLFLIAFMALGLPFVAAAQDEERGRAALEPTPEPAPTLQPGVTPTADRLAAPPTVGAPTQADDGAQLYWLHCQPCHGDKGQGLTDEWRAQYPVQEQYCWNSGCHGDRPYDDGFTIPTVVPAVVGGAVNQKFPANGALYGYIRASMPYWNPASLTDDEYLAITAHLARANGRWDGRQLTVESLAAEQTDVPQMAVPQTAVPAATTPTPAAPPPAAGGESMWGWAGLALAALVIGGGILLWLRANRSA
jgi:mono/diheme cytochrome c family protein